MRRTLVAALSFSLLAGACSADGGDPAGDDDEDGDGDGDSCPDGYGDGTCDPYLDCPAPDIDCFVLFESDEAAGAWFMDFETQAAAQESRPPRAQVASDDPRVARMRLLLDQGWEAYKETHEVGALRSSRPGLVVLEDPTVNAFVAPDLATGQAGLAVMVQTGLLELDASDHAMLGLVMHELEHAIALHIVGDVRDRLRTYYVARDGEPLGFESADDAVAREHGERWRELAAEAGPFTEAELGGLVLGGGPLSLVFKSVMAPRAELPTCEGPLASLAALEEDLTAAYSPLAADLVLEGSGVVIGLRDRVDAVLGALRDECLYDYDLDFVEAIAAFAGVEPQAIRDATSAEDMALIEGKHFIDGMATVIEDRRAKMRATEAALAEASGMPWSALRYYSYEEAADDATVPVLRAMALPPAGLGEFLFGVLDGDTQVACQEVLDQGAVPPYGGDFSDEHHATCWRVDHVAAVAAATGYDGASARTRRAAPAARPAVSRPGRLPIPEPLADRLAY